MKKQFDDNFFPLFGHSTAIGLVPNIPPYLKPHSGETRLNCSSRKPKTRRGTELASRPSVQPVWIPNYGLYRIAMRGDPVYQTSSVSLAGVV